MLEFKKQIETILELIVIIFTHPRPVKDIPGVWPNNKKYILIGFIADCKLTILFRGVPITRVQHKGKCREY
jgi:hypothetical protein